MNAHQSLMLAFIRLHIEKRGFSPSQFEIARVFGVSQPAVSKCLHRLARDGYVRLEPGWCGVKLL